MNVWKDDLNSNYSYKDILANFSKISLGRFCPTEIEDEYSNTNDGEFFNVNIFVDNKKNTVELKKSLFLDYDFLSLIVNWQSGNNVDGENL